LLLDFFAHPPTHGQGLARSSRDPFTPGPRPATSWPLHRPQPPLDPCWPLSSARQPPHGQPLPLPHGQPLASTKSITLGLLKHPPRSLRCSTHIPILCALYPGAHWVPFTYPLPLSPCRIRAIGATLLASSIGSKPPCFGVKPHVRWVKPPSTLVATSSIGSKPPCSWVKPRVHWVKPPSTLFAQLQTITSYQSIGSNSSCFRANPSACRGITAQLKLLYAVAPTVLPTGIPPLGKPLILARERAHFGRVIEEELIDVIQVPCAGVRTPRHGPWVSNDRAAMDYGCSPG